MSDTIRYEAIKLLARAQVERERGRFDSAIESLNQIIAVGEKNEWFTEEYTYRAAHAELFRIYESWGQDEKAFAYYKRAVQLGMNPDEIGKGTDF